MGYGKSAIYESFTKPEILEVHKVLYLFCECFFGDRFRGNGSSRDEAFEKYFDLNVMPNHIWKGKEEHIEATLLLSRAILRILDSAEYLEELDRKLYSELINEVTLPPSQRALNLKVKLP